MLNDCSFIQYVLCHSSITWLQMQYLHIKCKQTKHFALRIEAGPLFDFAVVNAMDDDCEHQVPRVSVYKSWLQWWRDDSCARYTTAAVCHQVKQEAALKPAHTLYLKPEYLPRGAPGEALSAVTESANVLIVLCINQRSILHSFFWDMTTEWQHTKDNGLTTEAYLALVGQQKLLHYIKTAAK